MTAAEHTVQRDRVRAAVQGEARTTAERHGTYRIRKPGFRADTCECGHTAGDHQSGGTRYPHPPRFGLCLLPGCECRTFFPDAETRRRNA